MLQKKIKHSHSIDIEYRKWLYGAYVKEKAKGSFEFFCYKHINYMNYFKNRI